MTVPPCLVRNLRHPARPQHTPFDDHEISILVGLFLQLRSAYVANKESVSKSLFDVLVKLHSTLGYNRDKKEYLVAPVTYGVRDVQAAFEHFMTLPREDLMPLNVPIIKELRSDGQQATSVDIVVSPKIHLCLFCNSSLDYAVKTTRAGGKAPGGHAWAYNEAGAHIAAVCEGKCSLCDTVFKLQTYTPGAGLMSRIGMDGTTVQNILLPKEHQNSEWLQSTSVTLVGFDLLFNYNNQRINNPALAFEHFLGQMVNQWGIHKRCDPGQPPPVDTIPCKPLHRFYTEDNNQGARYSLNEKRLSDAWIKGNIIMVINEHYKDQKHPPKVASRLNFLGNADELAALFQPTFELINLERWLHHVETCPDPMCGLVVCVDGNCKVVRRICGAELPASYTEGFDPSETDVQNVVQNNTLRKKRCDNLPVWRKNSQAFCNDCQARHNREKIRALSAEVAERSHDKGHCDAVVHPPEAAHKEVPCSDADAVTVGADDAIADVTAPPTEVVPPSDKPPLGKETRSRYQARTGTSEKVVTKCKEGSAGAVHAEVVTTAAPLKNKRDISELASPPRPSKKTRTGGKSKSAPASDSRSLACDDQSDEVDYSSLAGFLDHRLMKSMKRYLESEGCDNETDFEAENVIGVKLVRVGKKKEKRWLYLTTFRGYGIGNAWWCTRADLGDEMKTKADNVLAEYKRSYGSSESGIHVFITESLDDIAIGQITEELKRIVNMDPLSAKAELSKLLGSKCAQDLYERGVDRSLLEKALNKAAEIPQSDNDVVVPATKAEAGRRTKKQAAGKGNTKKGDVPTTKKPTTGKTNAKKGGTSASCNRKVSTANKNTGDCDVPPLRAISGTRPSLVEEVDGSIPTERAPSVEEGKQFTHTNNNAQVGDVSVSQGAAIDPLIHEEEANIPTEVHTDPICQENASPDVPKDGSTKQRKIKTTKGDRLECVPKDFSLAEGKDRSPSTKGTMVFMSPCGAKIFCTEMISSESLSILFNSLSRWVPLVKDRLQVIMAKKNAKNKAAKICKPGKKDKCDFPPIPSAETFDDSAKKSEAQFVIFYDYACGALASLRARMKYMKDNHRLLPDPVKSWALHSKWIVDKFHFKSHIGTVCKWSCNPNVVSEGCSKLADAKKRELTDFVNSQVQEQSFKDWNKRRYSTQNMRRSTFNFAAQLDVFCSNSPRA